MGHKLVSFSMKPMSPRGKNNQLFSKENKKKNKKRSCYKRNVGIPGQQMGACDHNPVHSGISLLEW